MKKADIYTIIERLEEIEDPRRSWGNKRHLLVDILFITLCAIASGMSEIDEIIIFAKERKEWLKKYISLKGGIPSYSTFERVYRMLTPKAMRIFYESWVMAIRPEGENKQVCIDGKAFGEREQRRRSIWSVRGCMKRGCVSGNFEQTRNRMKSQRFRNCWKCWT